MQTRCSLHANHESVVGIDLNASFILEFTYDLTDLYQWTEWNKGDKMENLLNLEVGS